MRAEIFQAVLAIFSHFFTLLAGCVATVLLALYEKFWRKEAIPRKVYAWIVIGFVFWACIGAIRDEQRNVRVLVGEKSKLSSDYGICTADLRFAREKGDFYQEQVHTQQQTINGQQLTMTAQQQTLNTAQQAQNAQQGTMNSCVVALGKANTPEPLRIVAKVAPLPMRTNSAQHAAVVIALTNKTVTPVRSILECDRPFKKLDALFAGESSIMYIVAPYISDTKSATNIDSPAWRPDTPFVFTVSYTGDTLPRCTVSQTQ